MGISRLIGSWESEAFKGAVYTFKEDGKGFYTFLSASKEFNYVDNGDSVKIYFVGDYAASLFKYSIKGDKLLICDSFGSLNAYIFIE